MKAFFVLLEVLINTAVLLFLMAVIPYRATGSWYFWDWHWFAAAMYCITFVCLWGIRTCNILDKRYSSKEEYEKNRKQIAEDLHTESFD